MHKRLSRPFNDARNKYEYDFNNLGRIAQSQMLEFRKLCGKTKYPTHLVQELLRQVYPLELVWQDLITCFDKKSPLSDASEGKARVGVIIEKIQQHQSQMEANIASYYSYALVNAQLSIEWLTDMAKASAAGNNEANEELEFAYVCYSSWLPVCLSWAALGLIGLGKREACEQLTCFSLFFDDRPANDDDFNDFKSAVVLFNSAITGRVSSGNIGPGVYRRLPPLW